MPNNKKYVLQDYQAFNSVEKEVMNNLNAMASR